MSKATEEMPIYRKNLKRSMTETHLPTIKRQVNIYIDPTLKGKDINYKGKMDISGMKVVVLLKREKLNPSITIHGVIGNDVCASPGNTSVVTQGANVDTPFMIKQE